MRAREGPRRLRPKRVRLSLTQQVALLSLLPVVALGFALTRVLEGQIVSRTLADASESAGLIARIGVQPNITPHGLRYGLDATEVRNLDQQLAERSVTRDLARLKIWNSHDRVVYSDDHSLIGRTLTPSDDLEHALTGRPNDAEVVTPNRYSETASEVGLGRLVEVYVPLRWVAGGPPVGAFEIYLSYRPIAAAISADDKTIALIVAIGLAILWAVLYRIVAQASRRLRRQAKANYRLARYDQLTGLPNRRLFMERLAQAVRRPDSGGGRVAVLLLDIAGFRQINSTLGSKTGDHALREVGRRLRDALADDAVVARLDADEYAILAPDVDGPTGALTVAEDVQRSLESPIVWDGVEVHVEANLGLAVVDEREEDLDTPLRQADLALLRAKTINSRAEAYSPDLDSFDASRLVLLAQVRRGLERGEFELFYQPKVDLASGRVCGVEALLRWRHPEQGLLAPMSFIPLVEQTALVGPVTREVVAQALRQVATWRELGLDLEMSLNLSARNLSEPNLASDIRALVGAHPIRAGQLTLEVTESAALGDPGRAVQALNALRADGIGVSIDDFGTGNASIAYLTDLPASEIKIDRSLVTDICGDRRAEAIVRSTIELARHLDLRVVAEGIETTEALERLAGLGCDVGQGYLISRPLPAGELTSWLCAHAGEPAVAPDGAAGGGVPPTAERSGSTPRRFIVARQER
jgi:diguanylate cyclase (GGDEF)-like protein